MKRRNDGWTTERIVNAIDAGNSNPTWSGKPYEPRPPASDAEIAQIQRSVDVQLDEYETAIAKAKAWVADWKARRRRQGFRAKRRQ